MDRLSVIPKFLFFNQLTKSNCPREIWLPNFSVVLLRRHLGISLPSLTKKQHLTPAASTCTDLMPLHRVCYFYHVVYILSAQQTATE